MGFLLIDIGQIFAIARLGKRLTSLSANGKIGLPQVAHDIKRGWNLYLMFAGPVRPAGGSRVVEDVEKQATYSCCDILT